MLNLKDPSLLQTQALINNQWIGATNGETIDVTNPFDNQVIGSVPSLQKPKLQTPLPSRITHKLPGHKKPPKSEQTY